MKNGPIQVKNGKGFRKFNVFNGQKIVLCMLVLPFSVYMYPEEEVHLESINSYKRWFLIKKLFS